MRRLIFLVLVLLNVALLTEPALAKEKRVALVMGNSDYQHFGQLQNPANDAKLVAEALKIVGFELVQGKPHLDQNFDQMREAIRQFGTMAMNADVALFYYAGHGVQVNGRNYLIPVCANIASERDIKYQLVDADFVLDELQYSQKTKTNIVILDACRNNPFAGRGLRSAGSGLAQMEAPKGTFIAYATAPGKVASDGDSDNSPFSSALAKYIQEPGLRVEDVFMHVGQEVEESTGGFQDPWQASNLRGVFYFLGPTEVTVQQPQVDKETVFWESIKDSDDPAMFQAYLDNYPGGAFADLAHIKANTKQNQPVTLDKIPLPVLAPAPVTTTSSTSGSSSSGTNTWTEPVTGMEFVWVPGGCYQMGCGSWQFDCYSNENPVHEVCVDSFWMGKYEVTQAQWQTVMGNNPSKFKFSSNPVEQVSWNDVQEFIRKLISRSPEAKLRLPREGEWEYACRSGGKAETYCGGNDVDRLAWYDGNSGSKTHPVGQKTPSGLGLYDMSGNVGEWCEDRFGDYPSFKMVNPTGLSGGPWRVYRGGSWNYPPRNVRSANRYWFIQDGSYFDLGFRLLRTE